MDEVRESIKDRLLDAWSNTTVEISTKETASRGNGGESFGLIRKFPSMGLNNYILNDQSDFDIDVPPGTFREELERFNEDFYE